MAFKFYIDGQLTDQPVNDTALSTTISRDNQIGGMVVTQDVRLIYNGNNNTETGVRSGYTILKNAFDTGTCDELVINIYDEVNATRTDFIYAGVIKVPSIQIDEQRILATVTVQDNSFYSYINNNKSIEYNCNSVKTKNRLDITPPDVYEVDCFDSTTGVYGSTVGFLYRGHRVYDVFRFIIAAISDNKIGFESLYLQQEPELFIFDGFALINANTDPTVKTSFAKLFDEVNKIKNIAFYIDTTDQLNPILRIEDKASLFSGLQVYEFEDIKELTARVKTDNIYGTVRVGASDNDGGAAPFIFTFESGISYLGWREEVYTPLGQCNFDNELNLVNDYGITHNDIHNQLVGATTEDEDKMFLIECENIDTALLTADATQYPSWIGTSDVYYNQGTNNPSKLLAHGSNYQTGLTNTLEIGTNGFRAERGQDLLLGSYNPASPAYVGVSGFLTSPIVFTDETTGSNFDGNNNYNNSTGVYVAPLDGTYAFNSELIVDAIAIKSCFQAGTSVGFTVVNSPTLPVGSYYTNLIRGFIVDLYITVWQDNTLAVPISNQTIKYKITQDLNQQPFTVSDLVNLTTGNAVTVSVLVQADVFAPAYFGNSGILTEVNNLPNWSVTTFGCTITGNDPKPAIYALENSVFKCTGAPDGGGIEIENDPRLFKNKEYEFTYHIRQEDFQLIKQNPTGLFTFEKDGITRQGWIDTIKRDDWTGIANVKLIAQNATTQE